MRRLFIFILVGIILYNPVTASAIGPVEIYKTGVIATGPAVAKGPDGSEHTWNKGYNMDLVRYEDEVAFDIQPNLKFKLDSGYEKEALDSIQADLVEKIVYHGYHRDVSHENYVLTQLLIYEQLDEIQITGIENLGIKNYEARKSEVIKKVNSHNVVPSFSHQLVKLNESDRVILSDTNKVLCDSVLKADGGFDVEVINNDLIIKTKANSPDNGTITFQKYDGLEPSQSYILRHPDGQGLLLAGNPEPVTFSLDVNVNQVGDLEITKHNSKSEPVSHTTFILSQHSDLSTLFGTYTTDASGKVLVNDLPVGTYYLQETNVPSPLIVDDTVHKVSISKNQLTSHHQINEDAKGQITLVVSGYDDNSNRAYDLVDRDNRVIQELTTDENGTAKTKILNLGDYTIKDSEKEISVSLHYADQVTPIVRKTVNIHHQIEETPSIISPIVQIVKVDSSGNPLAGAHLRLEDESGTLIKKWTSTSEPVVIKDLEKGQTYIIIEEKAPEGYQKAESIRFVAKDKQFIEVINRRAPVITTKASVLKRTEDNPDKVIIKDKVHYEGLIVGEIYTLSGILMDKKSGEPLISDGQEVESTIDFMSEGSGFVDVLYTLDSRHLKRGDVVVFETLLLDGKEIVHHHNLEDTNQTIRFKQFNLIKKIENQETVVAGVEFSLYQGDILLEKQVTDKFGRVTFVVEPGKYLVKETKVTDGLNPLTEAIELINTGIDSQLNDEIVVENSLKVTLPETGIDKTEMMIASLLVVAGVIILKNRQKSK